MKAEELLEIISDLMDDEASIGASYSQLAGYEFEVRDQTVDGQGRPALYFTLDGISYVLTLAKGRGLAC